MTNRMEMEEARKRILEHMALVTDTEQIPVLCAVGRIAARNYVASEDQPRFDRSPLDGFALQAEDICNASVEHPVVLNVVETVCAGDVPKKHIVSGQTVRIMTGAAIVEGADCVVRQEDVHCLNPDQVEFTMPVLKPLRKHSNICKKGEDVRAGSLLLERGTWINPFHGAVLAAQGIQNIRVFRKARVAVIATGSELTEMDRHLADSGSEECLPVGKIYNSNGPMLGMRLVQLGIEPETECICDDPDIILERIKQAADRCDAMITTGGVSVGQKDYLPEVIQKLGAEILFHGVDMKPGSPMLAAEYKGKMIFCLSGNPFAAAATFELLAAPGILKICGLRSVDLRSGFGYLADAFPKASDKTRRFIRAKRMDERVFIPEQHSSGAIYSMLDCNCFIDVQKRSKALKKGDLVRVIELADPARMAEKSSEPASAIPTLCICGRKNSGKTTLLEGLLPKLTEMGLRVGVIKHDGHDFIPDVPGTDSARLHAAGGKVCAVYSARRQSYYTEAEGDSFLQVRERLLRISGSLDLILVEGLKESEYDKIEVIRSEISEDSVVKNGTILAVCSDRNRKQEKTFALEDYSGLALLICEWLKAAR